MIIFSFYRVGILQERFVPNEITSEQFANFSKKYQSEIEILEQEISQHGSLSSNLKKSIEKGLKISQNISQIWISGDFYDKQKLQYLLFPEGMLYDWIFHSAVPIVSMSSPNSIKPHVSGSCYCLQSLLQLRVFRFHQGL
jgi:hypothetical protein